MSKSTDAPIYTYTMFNQTGKIMWVCMVWALTIQFLSIVNYRGIPTIVSTKKMKCHTFLDLPFWSGPCESYGEKDPKKWSGFLPTQISRWLLDVFECPSSLHRFGQGLCMNPHQRGKGILKRTLEETSIFIHYRGDYVESILVLSR